jgi:hypothetical protein
MPLETILTAPWGAAVRLEERDGPWGQFIAKTISDWLAPLKRLWFAVPRRERLVEARSTAAVVIARRSRHREGWRSPLSREEDRAKQGAAIEAMG